MEQTVWKFGFYNWRGPVGFKYISSKIDEVDAVLGGKSFGGLTVRGHPSYPELHADTFTDVFKVME